MAVDRDLIAKEAAIGMYDDQPARGSKRDSSVITAFPLLLLPWFVYNVLAVIAILSGSDGGSAYNAMVEPLFSLPMPSPGTKWTVAVGHIILL
ncbi:MAG: hypothetical protein JF615_04055, partial [Asticcacaulis sp.]|nr:hypothetical protein [Asticcacaulis sp.]